MKTKVVIVGAGFGGLWAARELARSDVEVLLIDRNNYHAFLPLLYQVAAAEIEPEQIAYPVRSILRKHPNVHFMMAEVTGVDFESQTISTHERDIDYDYLILAMGSKHHFFGVEGAEQFAYPLKTIDQSVRLRHQVLRAFERASAISTSPIVSGTNGSRQAETDTDLRQQLLTFAIVGGGPTGVEYAGALIELIKRPLKRDFPELDIEQVRVVLIEGTDRLLAMMPTKLSDYTLDKLQRMGVEVVLNAFVQKVTDDAVHLHTGQIIETDTVIWTAGVQGEAVADGWALPLAGAKQIAIEPTLQLPNLPNVYSIGDMAYLEQAGEPLPMLAQVAMQQGELAAKNIMRQVRGKPLTNFVYDDKGAMATIGRNAAVAEIGRFQFTGFFAWLVWLFIHLANLIGFRNRMVVLINWAWDYFFFERVARLILMQSKEQGEG